jgi:hypothetical protein
MTPTFLQIPSINVFEAIKNYSLLITQLTELRQCIVVLGITIKQVRLLNMRLNETYMNWDSSVV